MHRLAALTVLLIPSLAHAHGVHPHLREDTFTLAAVLAVSAIALVASIVVAGRKPMRLVPVKSESKSR